jgi:hypothetical protein
MYAGVPITMPVRVCDEPFASPVSFAMPKSSSLTKSVSRPRCARMMLSGFRSRWTMPILCDAASASATCMPIANARSGGSGACWRISADSVPPARYSMMKYTSCWRPGPAEITP